MENIIKKAINGGYYAYPIGRLVVLDTKFWEGLGKTCKWTVDVTDDESGKKLYEIDNWMKHALRFHEINLTEGWDKAVEYLSDLIKK